MNKKVVDKFVVMLGMSAIFILLLSAYYSIIGIGLLFSGSRVFASIMAGSFEFAKVTITSYLTRYWNKIIIIFRSYFLLAVIALITISSAGIYCYLTDAYHKTAHTYETAISKVEVAEGKSRILDEQKQYLINRNAEITTEINAIRDNIKRNDIQLTELYTATITDTTQSWYNNIYRLRTDNEVNRQYILELNDSKLANIENMDSLNIVLMDLSEKAAEISQSEELVNVGPLGRLSIIFNVDMDTIVKYFVLLIILIFDPLGVLLVVAFNKLLMDKRSIYKTEIKLDTQGKQVNEDLIDYTISKSTNEPSVISNITAVKDTSNIASVAPKEKKAIEKHITKKEKIDTRPKVRG